MNNIPKLMIKSENVPDCDFDFIVLEEKSLVLDISETVSILATVINYFSY